MLKPYRFYYYCMLNTLRLRLMCYARIFDFAQDRLSPLTLIQHTIIFYDLNTFL
jgi:hypothetical protein